MRRQPVRTISRSFLVALLFGALPAAAATITVNTLQDELNADGDCSLREALQAANANAVVDACTAGSVGLDTVVLPAGTIPLGVTISVTDAVTVRGAGRTSTTIQAGLNYAFNGPGVAGATITVEDLALAGFLNAGGPQDIAAARVDFSGSGGTIINTLNGSITITDCTLNGDGMNSLNGNISITNSTLTGGGVNSSGGALSLTSTTITGDGVNTSSGSISLTRSTISGATSNGVNSSTGAVTLVDSAVLNSGSSGINTSSGAISLTRSLVAGSNGEGISSYSGAVTVVNSTLSGNEYGIYASASVVTIDGSTIALSLDGGIEGSTPTVTMTNTIVAGNAPDCGVAVTSAQFSLSSDASCGLAGTGNLPNTNPLLGPLANNGGPTQTHLPQPGSPAIDAGSNALCQAVDQRGVARSVDGDGVGGATCDIGAVEAGAGVPPPPPPPPPARPTDIPTLSDWGLLALIALVALASARTLRRGRFR
jgi:CSLREA domain-containing protein